MKKMKIEKTVKLNGMPIRVCICTGDEGAMQLTNLFNMSIPRRCFLNGEVYWCK